MNERVLFQVADLLDYAEKSAHQRGTPWEGTQGARVQRNVLLALYGGADADKLV